MEFINANDLPAAGAMGTDNKVLVQQGDKFVLMTLAELLTYVASASVETDPTLTLGGMAAEALATGKAFKAARAVNLLDNSDFTNPVNQRGKTSYSGTAGYSIDRWRVTKMVDAVLQGTHIELTSTATSGANGFTQLLENLPVAGTPVTLAAMDDSGVLHVGSISMPASDHAVAFTVDTGVEGRVYTDRVSIMIPAGGSISLKWAALYEGEYTANTLPEYQPKGYAAELAECMRYFQKFGRVQVPGCALSDKSLLITPPCKTKMRAFPTLANVAFVHIRGGGVNITEFPTYTAAAFGADTANPNYTLTFDSTLGAVQFHAAMLYMSGELSADL